MRSKKGGILNQVVVQIILIGLVFAIFFMAVSSKINSRGVSQQILEKQMALLIDSAVPGMNFSISRDNLYGVVQKVEIKEGKILIAVSGLISLKGYPYFTKYSVSVVEELDKFVVVVE